MTDIVERLRDLYEYDEENQRTLSEAADEIERLRKDNNKLREIMWNIIYETKCALEEESDERRC